MDTRKVFDTIPDKFDKWRPRYSQELFDEVISQCTIDSNSNCLEIGPGTGQATDFMLNAGCRYMAIELGENLTHFMINKYKSYSNFHIINADFEKYNFEKETYDVVYSAAAIQWIQETVAYQKCYELLKKGRYLVMFFMKSEYGSNDPDLYNDIQKVYNEYFVSERPYMQRFNYENAGKYGFSLVENKAFKGKREYSAEEYAEYISTHSDHILIKDEYRKNFFDGITVAIKEHGGKIVCNDSYVLYIYKK